MTARHTAEQVEFVRALIASGAQAQSRASWTGYTARFGEVSYDSYAWFARNVKSGSAVVAAPAAEAPTLDDVSRSERDRLRDKAEASLLRELKGQRAITDEIVDRIVDALPVVQRIQIPVLPAPPSMDSRPQTALQLLSDLHVGNRVSREETGGLGEYSYDIFLRRLDRLQSAIRSITAHHRKSHPVPRLVMPWLGDMIENVDIFASQLEGVDLSLTDQVVNCVAALSEFTLGLLDTFEHVFVPVVTGNHGRIGKKGQHKRHVNWDYLIGKFVERELSAYRDRITFEVPKAAFAVVDVEGYKWLLRHGDGIKSWGGIPFYGINRSTGRWIAIQASQGQFFDYMAMGHFHTPTNLTYTGGEVVINGCFPGPTEFSVEVIETLNRPMQFFGMMHPRYGLAARYPILLDPPPARG